MRCTTLGFTGSLNTHFSLPALWKDMRVCANGHRNLTYSRRNTSSYPSTRSKLRILHLFKLFHQFSELVYTGISLSFTYLSMFYYHQPRYKAHQHDAEHIFPTLISRPASGTMTKDPLHLLSRRLTPPLTPLNELKWRRTSTMISTAHVPSQSLLTDLR